MVKRKANISLDEWLERGIAIPEANHPAAATAENEPVEGDSEWFWTFLAQS